MPITPGVMLAVWLQPAPGLRTHSGSDWRGPLAHGPM